MLQLQMYQRKVLISCMLPYLFSKNFNKVQNNNIKRTPKTIIFHVASGERTKENFNIAELYGAEINVNNNNSSNNNNNDKIWYSCCGKVIIVNGDTETEIIGYILEETNTYWKVELPNNCTTVHMLAPEYCSDTNS